MIREDILLAAAQVFGKVGYEKARLEDVARVVGIQKGSLYHHIRSKEQLLLALNNHMADEAMARTVEALEGATSPRERIRAVVGVLMQLIADHPDASIVFLHEFARPRSAPWARIAEKRDRYERLLRRVIADGMRDGAFRQFDVKVATLGVLGMVNWAHRWYRPGAGMSASAIADVFSDVLLNGLTAPKGTNGHPRMSRRTRLASRRGTKST